MKKKNKLIKKEEPENHDPEACLVESNGADYDPNCEKHSHLRPWDQSKDQWGAL